MSTGLIRDDLTTETQIVQEEAVRECNPYLNPYRKDNVSLPQLDVEQHTDFLLCHLQRLPPQYVGYDATRPWLVYWSLMGLHMLGENLAQYRSSVVATLRSIQNPRGGFGGSFGQISHIACSYAAVLSLVAVGGKEALELIDRRSMWSWLGRLRQRDGGFLTSIGGEQDVRGAYCAMTIASLLQLPTHLPHEIGPRQSGLTDGLCDYLKRCQSYEGGMSASPGSEAHGGYAFCALACLSILGSPSKMLRDHLDLDALISWLSARQYHSEGGFSGRTNKLVDACYGWWIGGCWPIVEAALQNSSDLYDVQALQEYILCCCQAPNGGLRDKPSKPADAYHTCYTMAGYRSSQKHARFTESLPTQESPYEAATKWAYEGNSEHRAMAIHPLYVIPLDAAEAARDYFQAMPIQF